MSILDSNSAMRYRTISYVSAHIMVLYEHTYRVLRWLIARLVVQTSPSSSR